MTLEDQIWAVVEPSIYISRADYFARLEGWTITPHEVDGEAVGVVLTRGPELHFVAWGKWGMRRDDIRHYLNPLLAKYGRVETKTPVDQLRMQRFNKILGFVESHRDELYVYFALVRGPFLRIT